MKQLWAVCLSIAICTWTSLVGADDPGQVEIDRLNAAIESAGLKWRAARNKFFGLSAAERARYASGSKSPPADLLKHFEKRRPDPFENTVQYDLPLILDWRDRNGANWVTPVRDQASCGSCWAFATIANLESLVAWERGTANPMLDLSEQHLFSCSMAAYDCDSGGLTWLIPGSFLQDTGVTTEECYPYTSGTTGDLPDCESYRTFTTDCQQALLRFEDLTEIECTAPGDSIFDWLDPADFTLSANQNDSGINAEEVLKTYLQDRPVGVSLRVFDSLYGYSDGIYEPLPGDSRRGLHAVLLVGYNDIERYWIAKNSWGDDWGEAGFFRIRYDSSSIGMFAFVYYFTEELPEPAFCDDLPQTIVLDGSLVDYDVLTIRNCGRGVLHWQAQMDQDWILFEDGDGLEVDTGSEVAKGTSYRIACSRQMENDMSGSITLTGASNGPVVIRVDLVTGNGPDAGVDQDGDDGQAGLDADGGMDGQGQNSDGSLDAGLDAGQQVADSGAAPNDSDAEIEASSCSCVSLGGRSPALASLSILGVLLIGRRRRSRSRND